MTGVQTCALPICFPVTIEVVNHQHDHKSLDERNLHFLLSDRKKPLRVLKGQYRFYGTKEQFEANELSKYFTIYDDYVPSHHIVAIDYSAQEPRVNAIVTREPSWLRSFEGSPKAITREIRYSESLPKTNQFAELDGHKNRN